MEATKKNFRNVVSFVRAMMKEKAVKAERESVNVELLTDLFRATKLKDFRAIVEKYSTEEILKASYVHDIYEFYCMYYGASRGAGTILEFLIGAKKAGKKRRCLV